MIVGSLILEVLKLMGFVYLNECIHYCSLKDEEVDLVDCWIKCVEYGMEYFLGFFLFFLGSFPIIG